MVAKLGRKQELVLPAACPDHGLNYQVQSDVWDTIVALPGKISILVVKFVWQNL